jgi:hypothetical protein
MCQGGISRGLSRVRLSLGSIAIATCCILAPPPLGSAQVPSTETRTNRERPRVQVSRDELRIEFPRDTAHRWGWSAAPAEPPNAPRYSWRMEVDAIEGPSDIRFDVRSGVPFPSVFSSLRELVDTGHGFICRYGMATTCGETRMAGAAAHGRAVFTLRDSALISRTFALRPRFVRLTNDRPETSFVWDSVPIEYSTPGVQPLDSATRANALRARRRESLAHFRVQRGIMGGRGASEHIWLVVGDSLPLVLFEVQRLEDLGMSGQRDLSDSGWAVLDPRIAQLITPSPDRESARALRSNEKYITAVDYGPPRRFIKALRPGITAVRVRGVHGLLDAALDSDLPSGVLERDVVVTRAPQRLTITPRPDTLRADEYLDVRVRVYDAVGDSTTRVPVELECTGCIGSHYYGARPIRISPNARGRMTLVAKLDSLADTLSIVVVDSVRR